MVESSINIVDYNSTSEVIESNGNTQDIDDFYDLPAIDLSQPEEQIVQELMRVLTTVGFFSISNVPDFDEDELLRAVTAFYKEVPSEER